MSTLEVYNQTGKKVDKVTLDTSVFDGKINHELMQQAVSVFLANQRKGLAVAKSKGEVRGGGRKPWRQKGTGRARVGSIRSPLWRGGGIIFGPVKRDYSQKLNRRMKALALKSALNAKLADKELVLIDSLPSSIAKTKELAVIIRNLKLGDSRLKIVVEKSTDSLKRAAQNIDNCALEKASGLNTYAALQCKKIIFTVGSLKLTEERIKKWLT